MPVLEFKKSGLWASLNKRLRQLKCGQKLASMKGIKKGERERGEKPSEKRVLPGKS